MCPCVLHVVGTTDIPSLPGQDYAGCGGFRTSVFIGVLVPQSERVTHVSRPTCRVDPRALSDDSQTVSTRSFYNLG